MSLKVARKRLNASTLEVGDVDLEFLLPRDLGLSSVREALFLLLYLASLPSRGISLTICFACNRSDSLFGSGIRI